MRKLFAVPMAALAAVGLLACSESPTESPMSGVNFQLISGGYATGNATVFGTWTVEIGGGSGVRESGPGINSEGKEMGSCGLAGRWTNPAGRATGAIPHAHCVSESLADIYTRRHRCRPRL
jgi:hypothetical protein